MQNKKTIGIGVSFPRQTCKDLNCPFHGTLKVHGRIFNGNVTKTDPNKSATIEFLNFCYIPKYERYEKRITRLKVHNPLCINAKVGDYVKIIESRPISKTKNFVVVEVVKE